MTDELRGTPGSGEDVGLTDKKMMRAIANGVGESFIQLGYEGPMGAIADGVKEAFVKLGYEGPMGAVYDGTKDAVAEWLADHTDEILSAIAAGTRTTRRRT